MAEMTRLGTESMTVRRTAIGLLQFRVVNVKPTADQVWDGGMSCIVRNAFLENLHVEPVRSHAGSSSG